MTSGSSEKRRYVSFRLCLSSKSQIEAQRKRVWFGEEEQRNDAKFSGGSPEMERVEFAPAMA